MYRYCVLTAKTTFTFSTTSWMSMLFKKLWYNKSITSFPFAVDRMSFPRRIAESIHKVCTWNFQGKRNPSEKVRIYRHYKWILSFIRMGQKTVAKKNLWPRFLFTPKRQLDATHSYIWLTLQRGSAVISKYSIWTRVNLSRTTRWFQCFVGSCAHTEIC